MGEPVPLRGWRLFRTELGWKVAEWQRAAVMRLPESARWRIAKTVERIPGQCWADLVDWVLSDDPGYPWRPWAPDTHCRADIARCGSCYCGKFREEAPDA